MREIAGDVVRTKLYENGGKERAGRLNNTMQGSGARVRGRAGLQRKG